MNESSMFSPPQTSSPESYVPSSKKYFFSMENKPPAITGHLQQVARCKSGGQNAPISFTFTKGLPRNRAVRCLGSVCGFALTVQTLGPILLVPTDKGNIKNTAFGGWGFAMAGGVIPCVTSPAQSKLLAANRWAPKALRFAVRTLLYQFP